MAIILSSCDLIMGIPRDIKTLVLMNSQNNCAYYQKEK